MASLEPRERLRRLYRPAKLRLLFIGEAPPISGRFFYQRDSGLYRAIRDAFIALDPSISDDTFLDVFQRLGCYLIDTCQYPIDHLGRRERRAARYASEASLARRIKTLQPPAILVLLRSIRENVERAALRAGWRGRLLFAPYPGRWVHHRKAFCKVLAPELENLSKAVR